MEGRKFDFVDRVRNTHNCHSKSNSNRGVSVDEKRNTLIKIAGIGSVLTISPTKWMTPIVSSVVLPAHAQTSCPDISQSFLIDKDSDQEYSIVESAGCIQAIASGAVPRHGSIFISSRFDLNGVYRFSILTSFGRSTLSGHLPSGVGVSSGIFSLGIIALMTGDLRDPNFSRYETFLQFKRNMQNVVIAEMNFVFLNF